MQVQTWSPPAALHPLCHLRAQVCVCAVAMQDLWDFDSPWISNSFPRLSVIKGIPCSCTQVYIRLHLHYPLLIHLIKCIHSYMSTVEWRSRPCSSLWTRWCTFELKLKSEEQSAKPASPAKPQQSSLPPYVNYYHLQPLLNTKHLHSKQLSVCFYQAMMSPFSIRVKLWIFELPLVYQTIEPNLGGMIVQLGFLQKWFQ